ncbi:hypothetical protein B0H17DRAFT_1139740 [Mycena rosella]|uniref:Uncharacterized protein n=1 Tax=Mycena rosella TaxID=1033263 RepID=A0AAD7D3S8_MYCRO|nr:hypothetical protein B0H17DRAFT_1139740 [Mycena rosella]
MPPKRKKTADSEDDTNYRAPSVSKRARQKQKQRETSFQAIDTFFQTSSAPTSPRIDAQSTPQDDRRDLPPLPALFSQMLAGGSTPGPSTQPRPLQTPQKQIRRATSESPGQFPSPATSTVFASPEKPQGGHPRTSKANRNPRKSREISNAERKAMRATAKEQSRARDLARKKERTCVEAERRRIEAEVQAKDEKMRKRTEAYEIFSNLTKLKEKGGAGHGKDVIQAIVDRVPAVGEEFIDQEFDGKLDKVLQAEGAAIQKLLSRDWTVDVMTLLQEFSMEELAQQLIEVAPTLWRILETVSTASASTRRKSQVEASVSRSQKANNYQVVIGLFLLASGSSKREMEVLAHAGLSTSYNTIKDHIHKLSAEGAERFRDVSWSANPLIA